MTHERTPTGTSRISGSRDGRKQQTYGGVIRFSIFSRIGAMAMLLLAAVSLSLSGCGGSGGLSTQVVSGVAAVGEPLSGEVSLKDSSSTPREKTTVIGNDGSFAIDVTDMEPPFILRAKGKASGNDYELHSFAGSHGIANINPLSEVVVAGAAEVDDCSGLYERPDREKLHKIRTNLSTVVTALLEKLQPLLQQYSAEHTNPITSRYIANHLGLDGMFDHVKIKVRDGMLSITYTKTGEVIFTGKVTDIANGNFNPGTVSPPEPTAVPTGLTATGGAGQVTLAWTSVSNATSYNVYYSTASGVTTASGTRIAGVTTPYTHTGLSAGTTYYYVVTAVSSAGESAASSQVSAVTDAALPPPTVPSSPTGVISTGGTRQVTVSWSAVTGASSYNLYWSKTSGVTTANGTKITGATSPAVHTGLSDSTVYYYIVTAVNSVGESAPSVQVAATTLAPTPAPTPPATPGGVSATGGTNQATVSWSPVSGATSYNIYWSATSGAGKNGTKLAGVTSPYVHTGLSAGTTYYYVVTAVNAAGESTASSQAAATTNAPPPAVPSTPTGLTATGGAKQVSVSWPAVSGATSYNLYWSTASGVTTATGTKIAGATSPYLQTGLAAGTTYYYVVTAANASGESPASAQVTATTNAPAPVVPTAPTGVTASGGANQVVISWPAVSGATSYSLYWSTTSGAGINGTKVTGVTSPYTHSGLSAGTTYYYVITAVNAAGESSASTQVSAATNAPAPAFDALAFYNDICLGCHGSLGPRTAAQITTAINGVGSMRAYRSTGTNPLTAAQIAAIAAVSY